MYFFKILYKILSNGKQKRLEKYRVTEVIERSHFGYVAKAIYHSDDKLFVIKTVYLSKILIFGRDLSQEHLFLDSCRHPNIVKVMFWHLDQDNYYLVLEYLMYGDLFNWLVNDRTKPTMHQVKNLLAQTARALEFCHGNYVAHCDLKLENIMFSDHNRENIKLIDFGFACSLRKRCIDTASCGTLEYYAPEIAANRAYHPIQRDTWSFAVIMYILLTGNFPFDGTESEIITSIATIKYQLNDCPSSSRDLISGIFQVESCRTSLSKVTSSVWLRDYYQATGLPVYATEMNPNMSLVDKISDMGYDKATLIHHLSIKYDCAEVALYHSEAFSFNI